MSCSSRERPEGSFADADAGDAAPSAKVTFLVSFLASFAVRFGGVGGVGAAPEGGTSVFVGALPFTVAFAAAFFGRPTGATEVRVVVVFPQRACIREFHCFVVMNQCRDRRFSVKLLPCWVAPCVVLNILRQNSESQESCGCRGSLLMDSLAPYVEEEGAV